MVPMIFSFFKNSRVKVFDKPCIMHSDWICLPPPALISQVAVYCHKRILQRFHVAVDHKIFNHPNILLFTVCNTSSNSTLSFINQYNNPNRDAMPPLHNCVPTLLQCLPLVQSLRLCQGDFNLHCSYWDENLQRDNNLSWEVINALNSVRLSLVNDESTPTFYRG